MKNITRKGIKKANKAPFGLRYGCSPIVGSTSAAQIAEKTARSN